MTQTETTLLMQWTKLYTVLILGQLGQIQNRTFIPPHYSQNAKI